MTDSEVLQLLLENRPLMDVRAPVEFDHGSLPGATNLFLLNDDERARVGTTYKVEGSEAAVRLGHQIISGQTLDERLAKWMAFARANPSVVVYCFRGGMRSQSVQGVLRQNGLNIPLIDGGYKRVRRLLIDEIERASREDEIRVISGFTGSGKTELLRAVSADVRVCDLEGLSNHKGSAFGGNFRSSQPAQADFENRLALQLLRSKGPIYTEDESRMIGRTVVPIAFHAKMMSSSVYLVERSRHERAVFLTRSYLEDNFDLVEGSRNEATIRAAGAQMKASLRGIIKRLGGAEFARLSQMVDEAVAAHLGTGSLAVHLPWVERLLKIYYDPMYAYQIERLSSRVVFKGTWDEVRDRIARP